VRPADDILFEQLAADFPAPDWEVWREGLYIKGRRAGSPVTYIDTSATVVRAHLARVKHAEQVSRVAWPGQ
jgi:hypothetical protein